MLLRWENTVGKYVFSQKYKSITNFNSNKVKQEFIKIDIITAISQLTQSNTAIIVVTDLTARLTENNSMITI